MTGREHIVIGAGSTAFVIGAWQYSHGGLELSVLVPAIAAATAGSLAPDLDHHSSWASLAIPSALIASATAFLLSRWYTTANPNTIDIGLTRLGPQLVVGAWVAVATGVGLVLLSLGLRAAFGHRGPVHSVAFGLMATVIVLVVSLLVGWPVWVSLVFLWGWVAHLAADAITPAGLSHAFWPLSGS